MQGFKVTKKVVKQLRGVLYIAEIDAVFKGTSNYQSSQTFTNYDEGKCNLYKIEGIAYISGKLENIVNIGINLLNEYI